MNGRATVFRGHPRGSWRAGQVVAHRVGRGTPFKVVAPVRVNGVSMFVAVMHIGKMRVGVLDGFVNVRVRMRFLSLPAGSVLMLVMGIVNMRVLVLQS